MEPKTIMMDAQAVLAQIDVCGSMVAFTAENAYGAVDDEVIYDLNQAVIALEHAMRLLSKKQGGKRQEAMKVWEKLGAWRAKTPETRTLKVEAMSVLENFFSEEDRKNG